jgi:hypothetical protein
MAGFTSLAVGFADLELADYRVVAEAPCVGVRQCPFGQQQCTNDCRQLGGTACAGTCTLAVCVCGNIG